MQHPSTIHASHGNLEVVTPQNVINLVHRADQALPRQMSVPPKTKRTYVKKCRLGISPQEIQQIAKSIISTLQVKGRLTIVDLEKHMGQPKSLIQPILDVLIATPLVNEVKRSGDFVREDRSFMFRYGNVVPEAVDLATLFDDIKGSQEEINMCARRIVRLKQALEEIKQMDHHASKADDVAQPTTTSSNTTARTTPTNSGAPTNTTTQGNSTTIPTNPAPGHADNTTPKTETTTTSTVKKEVKPGEESIASIVATAAKNEERVKLLHTKRRKLMGVVKEIRDIQSDAVKRDALYMALTKSLEKKLPMASE